MTSLTSVCSAALSCAREISLGGRWVSAQQAADWGFVNRVVAPNELMPTALALAADMLLAQAGMLERYKAIIDDGFALPFGAAMALERQRAREFNATVHSPTSASASYSVQ